MRLQSLSIFVMTCVLVQYSPLRMCAIQKLASGTDCHETRLGDSDDESRAHTDGEPCNEGSACHCQQPRLLGERARLTQPLPLDLSEFGLIVIARQKASCLVVMADAASRPPDVLRALQMPLLT